METLISDFNAINSNAAMSAFADKYALTEAGSPETFIMATYSGIVNGNDISIVHRWYDRCKTYQIREDGNEISLEIRNTAGETVFKSMVKYLQD